MIPEINLLHTLTDYLPFYLLLPTLPPFHPPLSATTTSSCSFTSTPTPLITPRCHQISDPQCKLKG